MQYLTSRGSTQLAVVNSEQPSNPLAMWQVEQWRRNWSGCHHARFHCRLHHWVHWRLQVQATVSTEQFVSDSTFWCRSSAMFPASGVRPNSSVLEEFQTLSRFRSEDDSRTLPVAGASAEQTVWSSLFQFHGLRLCASPVVSQRSTSGRQTPLSTWTLQQRLTKDSCHR